LHDSPNLFSDTVMNVQKSVNVLTYILRRTQTNNVSDTITCRCMLQKSIELFKYNGCDDEDYFGFTHQKKNDNISV